MSRRRRSNGNKMNWLWLERLGIQVWIAPTVFLYNNNFSIYYVPDVHAYPPTSGHHGSLRRIVWSEFTHNPFLDSKHRDKSFSGDIPMDCGTWYATTLSGNPVSKYEMKNVLESFWFRLHMNFFFCLYLHDVYLPLILSIQFLCHLGFQ